MPVPKNEYMSSVWRDDIFKGKVVFCTGGAGTICSAQVRALVHLGANAAIIGRNVEKTASMAKDIETCRPGSKVLGLGGVDVRSIESLTAAAERTVKELGAIDFVIAGAAGNFLAPLTGLSANAFKTVIDIDVIGSFNTLKATLPYLSESAQRNPNSGSNASTGGRIIFVSATLHYIGTPFQTHVVAAKAGVDALAGNAAIELGPRGITSNVIAPGPIAGTEGMERLSGGEAKKNPLVQRAVPVGRYGLVKEIADATVYLFSDAGNYVNGETLIVDGGSFRVPTAGFGGGLNYPDNVLQGVVPKGAKSGRRDEKL